MSIDLGARWLPLTLVALTIAGGAYLRVAQLGSIGFGPDELNHYYVAEALHRGEGPLLPSGEIYTRGIDVSRLVGLSVRTFGPDERSVRLPTAAFGILNLLLFAIVLWALGGPWVAFWGTVFLAIYPQAVHQSRFLRFYTYQLNFGLLALLAGWYAVRDFGSGALPEGRALRRQWMWAVVTVAALLMARRVQIVSLSVAAGWGVIVALAAGFDMRARGWQTWRRSVPVQLMLAGGVGFAATAAMWPSLFPDLLAASQFVPYWALAANAGHPLGYYYSLVERFPMLVSLAPLLFVLVMIRRPRLGLYLAVWFAVPVLLHSFVFPWKGARFILLAVPALFTTGAIVAAWGAGALYRLVEDRIARLPASPRLSASASAAVVALVAVAMIATTPAFNVARKMIPGESPGGSGWREAAVVLQSRQDLAMLPVGSSSPLQALFYSGRLDFVVGIGDELEPGDDGQDVPLDPHSQERDIRRDRRSGVPVLPTAERIREHFAGSGAVLVVVDTRYVDTGVLERSLVQYLWDEAEELCQGGCGATRAFLWRFEAPEPNHRPDER